MSGLISMINLLACPTCLPDRGSQASIAQGNAILFMLILLAFVLSLFIYTIFSFARKQKRALAALAAAEQNPPSNS